MENFALALFWGAVFALPSALLLLRGRGKKRGCGGGCAGCGNREICWRGRGPGGGGGKKEENARD